MTRRLKNVILRIISKFKQDEQKILMLLGQANAARVKKLSNLSSLTQAEFKIFSQWGEDGIIQYLISKIEIPNKVFVEFGVENYLESNTRFLLMNDNWSGLVIDGSEANIDFIKKDQIYWRYDIQAVHSFITKENINSLLKQFVQTPDIGILSVDVDGNDYWILEQINVVNPRILICEFNNIFGAEYPITVPYSPDFVRRNAHYSDLYFGASLLAFYQLALSKGYDFVGINSAGMNAFFVRKDLSSPFKKFNPQEVFFSTKIRESRDRNGQLSFLRGQERLAEIKNTTVFDISTQQLVTIKELFNL